MCVCVCVYIYVMCVCVCVCVQDATHVLFCLSREMQSSARPRTLAALALERGVKIMGINVSDEFEPQGWLRRLSASEVRISVKRDLIQSQKRPDNTWDTRVKAGSVGLPLLPLRYALVSKET